MVNGVRDMQSAMPHGGSASPLPRHQHALEDAAFLAEFDLTLPGLAAGRLNTARAALVEHFRHRRSPRWVMDLRAHAEPIEVLFHVWIPRVISDRNALLHRADLACANRLTVAEGMTLDFGPSLDWVNEETCSLIVPGNCFKCCHWLRDLAFAWVITRNSRYAAKWAELVTRWLQDFPMMLDDDFTGEEMIFNRRLGEKSMPTGARLFNWLSSLYSGIVFAPEVDTETAFQFIKALWYNGAVYQHFEHSPFQAHNHHIMRTVNVPACMALAFPETPRFEGLATLARDRMARHARDSFLSDGGYVERSSSYAQVTMGMFAVPLALARLNGIELAGPDTVATIRRAVEFYATTVLPTGALPPCGDGLSTDPPATAGMLAMAAAACDSGVVRSVLCHTGLADLLPRTLRPEPSEAALPRHVHRPKWGIAVLRTAWDPEASAFSMNIPDGMNDNHSHAHDDAMACSLVVRGRHVIDVPADELYIYVNSKAWADTPHYTYFRSSLGKNVVLPSGRPRLDPSTTRGGWLTDTPPVVSGLSETASGTELRASTTILGVDWERTVTLTGETWIVVDRLVRPETAEHDAPHLLQWHFAYGVGVIQTADGVIAENGSLRMHLMIEADTPWESHLDRNTNWLSPNTARAGQPAPWLFRVRFGVGAPDASVTTRFVPEQ